MMTVDANLMSSDDDLQSRDQNAQKQNVRSRDIVNAPQTGFGYVTEMWHGRRLRIHRLTTAHGNKGKQTALRLLQFKFLPISLMTFC
jgi:hypothetical protein